MRGIVFFGLLSIGVAAWLGHAPRPAPPRDTAPSEGASGDGAIGPRGAQAAPPRAVDDAKTETRRLVEAVCAPGGGVAAEGAVGRGREVRIVAEAADWMEFSGAFTLTGPDGRVRERAFSRAIGERRIRRWTPRGPVVLHREFIADLVPGRYAIRVSPKGGPGLGGGGFQPSSVEVDLGRDAPARVDVEVTVNGWLRIDSGVHVEEPWLCLTVAGGEVEPVDLSASNSDTFFAGPFLAGRGRFTLAGEDGGAQFITEFEADFHPGRETRVRLFQGVEPRLLTGRVVGSDGRPVAADVVLSRPGSEWPILEALTGEDGLFDIRGEMDKAVSVDVHPVAAARYASTRYALASLGTTDQTLVVERRPRELRTIEVEPVDCAGRLVHGRDLWITVMAVARSQSFPARAFAGCRVDLPEVDGVPVGDVEVCVWAPELAASGRTRAFVPPPPAPAKVRVSVVPTGASARVRVSGSDSLRLRLLPAGRVQCPADRPLGLQPGEPSTPFLSGASRTTSDPWLSFERRDRSERGEFALQGLPVLGGWILELAAPGGTTASVPIRLRPGDVVEADLD